MQTEGALSKALSVAGLMDPGHAETLTAYSDYSGQNKARFQVHVAEATTSIELPPRSYRLHGCER